MGAFTRIVFLLLLGLAAWAGPAGAASERIERFESLIRIHRDGSVTVTETIAVTAAGRDIKRGIYREFPTTYKDRFGNTVRAGFEVVEVLRDGRTEPWHVRLATNGKRIYMGDKNVFLKPGRYTYTITYRTDRQLGFFEDFDELYWNVTGNGWAFPIATAKAVIELPDGATVTQAAGYTGPQGAQGQDFTLGHDVTGTVVVTTTRTLAPGEGLTVAVAWPKGFVIEPTAENKARYLLQDNASLVVGIIGLAVLLAFYLFAWWLVGRDPRTGTIIPRFRPPEGFSPAAMRYVMKMGYSDKVFAAALVSMAVKGYLDINEDEDGEFTLVETGDAHRKLSAGERRIATHLLDGMGRVKLEQKNHKRISTAIKALKETLQKDFRAVHFRRNLPWFLAGLGVTLMVLGSVVFNADDLYIAAFMSVWLTGWTFGCYTILAKVWRYWQGRNKVSAIILGLFSVPFLGGEVFGLVMLSEAIGGAATATLLLAGLINAVFYELLKAPTVVGRMAMNEIEGFKMYMEVAEKDRLDILHPPEQTPSLFEKYLPFALALDVEHEWSEQFAGVLAAAGQGSSDLYRPRWYSGRSWDRFGSGGFADSLGSSFSGAIASSSTAPGSSSGSGGGGFSGGGGGGGGGGGW